MRVLTSIGMFALSLLLGACSDEEPSPTVDEAISWQVCEVSGSGGCLNSLTAHAQSLDMEHDFKVSCSKTSSGWSFTLEDPGVDSQESTSSGVPFRYGSKLSVSNVTEAGSCNVTVTEMSEGDSSAIDYVGNCAEGCQIQVQPPSGGWDFIANLSCTALYPGGNPNNAAYSLYNLSSKSQPVRIQLGNCN